jgi:UDP-glucose 4-epimerase
VKRILIIGGCGYIGSKLYKHLDGIRAYDAEYMGVASGHYAIDTVDLVWFGNVVNPNNLIMDYRHLTKEQLRKYDAVILLAAHSSVPMANNSSFESTYKNNVTNFVELLGKLSPIQKFIYMGSASVYNGIPGLATEEDILNNPSNVYDLTKQELDRIISLYPNVEYYGLRLATVNGWSPNLRTDIMVNGMVESAILNGHIKLFNPTIRRPILDIRDLVRAIRAIIDTKEDLRGIYNLASYNGAAADIAHHVAHTLDIDVETVTQADVERTLNTKLPTVYDFAISAEKFAETFNFTFEGTIGGIATNLQQRLTATKNIFGGPPFPSLQSKRIQGKEYNGL